MSTLPGEKPPQGQERHPSKDGPDVIRAIMIMVGGAIGAILAVTLVGAAWSVDAVATAAISAISAVVGAAIGVVALEVRRLSK
jgi:uncharacterized membrane protein YcjF (UPF0283 family)